MVSVLGRRTNDPSRFHKYLFFGKRNLHLVFCYSKSPEYLLHSIGIKPFVSKIASRDSAFSTGQFTQRQLRGAQKRDDNILVWNSESLQLWGLFTSASANLNSSQFPRVMNSARDHLCIRASPKAPPLPSGYYSEERNEEGAYLCCCCCYLILVDLLKRRSS